VLCLAAVVMVAGCGSSDGAGGSPTNGRIAVVAAENQYGSVASQIGGRYVSVTSVESNPNTDPHTYEVSPAVAQAVSVAQVVIENGVGYDDYMSKVVSASPSPTRRVLNVQHVLGLPDNTANPHLWYDPDTMPKVADVLAADFASIDPSHAVTFRTNAATFIRSMGPWLRAIDQFRATYPGTPVATTEPVADSMLEAAGTENLTPFTLQADLMNGVDPSPQDVSFQASLFAHHKVKVLVYNQQVTDPLTQSFIADARRAGIPVVGVYETMPVPGYDYPSWMLAEITALRRAVVDHASTSRL
jgi:zinc/manganese transport system substrate-binding protein